MSFHAYSKRQFYALNFDTTPYRKLIGDDFGTACARLDCKRWGTHCMFVYLTLDRGYKVVAAKSLPRFFSRIPPAFRIWALLIFRSAPLSISTLTGKSMEIKPGLSTPNGSLMRPILLRLWQNNWGSIPSQTVRVLPVLRSSEHRLCADKAGTAQAERGAAPVTPNLKGEIHCREPENTPFRSA